MKVSQVITPYSLSFICLLYPYFIYCKHVWGNNYASALEKIKIVLKHLLEPKNVPHTGSVQHHCFMPIDCQLYQILIYALLALSTIDL